MIKTLSNQGNSGKKKLIWFLWSWVMPAVILFVIALKFIDNKEALSMLNSVGSINGMGVALCLSLFPLNMGIEAWKWQYILQPVQKQSVVNCSKIILAGKSLNVVSPFGIGDGFSRYMGLSKENRNQIFASLTIDRFSQLIPTLCFGIVSVFFLVGKGLAISASDLSLLLVIFSALVGLLCLAFIILRNHTRHYLLLFRSLDFTSFVVIGSLSFARYFVFVAQFYLIFWALDIQLPMLTIFYGIFWIFLIKTLIPNLSVLGDLVKRELSATLFFSFFISDLSEVIVAGFVVWLINIVLPALIGLLFVSDLKKTF